MPPGRRSSPYLLLGAVLEGHQHSWCLAVVKHGGDRSQWHHAYRQHVGFDEGVDHAALAALELAHHHQVEHIGLEPLAQRVDLLRRNALQRFRGREVAQQLIQLRGGGLAGWRHDRYSLGLSNSILCRRGHGSGGMALCQGHQRGVAGIGRPQPAEGKDRTHAHVRQRVLQRIDCRGHDAG
jgi:hypothetical protein